MKVKKRYFLSGGSIFCRDYSVVHHAPTSRVFNRSPVVGCCSDWPQNFKFKLIGFWLMVFGHWLLDLDKVYLSRPMGRIASDESW